MRLPSEHTRIQKRFPGPPCDQCLLDATITWDGEKSWEQKKKRKKKKRQKKKKAEEVVDDDEEKEDIKRIKRSWRWRERTGEVS